MSSREENQMTHDRTTTAADGTAIAWSRRSSSGGVPVVLVHGITESAGSFDPVVDRLVDAPTAFDVITLDLRGHGQSGHSASADPTDYDLTAMAGDVIAVIGAAGLVRPDGSAPDVHLVGHSLGGAVVTAVGSAIPVASIVNIDQSLRLASFKEQLVAAEPLLRDPDQYRVVIHMMFDSMSGELLSPDERARVEALRRPDQDVVLGVWDLLLTETEEAVERTVEAMLAGYRNHPTPYLALFGLDPGDEYASWLGEHIGSGGASLSVELWPDHGHYPHLVDPDRFVRRITGFWGG
jgi:pimeloyl-ACP methyl ester carboxylesterase